MFPGSETHGRRSVDILLYVCKGFSGENNQRGWVGSDGWVTGMCISALAKPSHECFHQFTCPSAREGEFQSPCTPQVLMLSGIFGFVNLASVCGGGGAGNVI